MISFQESSIIVFQLFDWLWTKGDIKWNEYRISLTYIIHTSIKTYSNWIKNCSLFNVYNVYEVNKCVWSVNYYNLPWSRPTYTDNAGSGVVGDHSFTYDLWPYRQWPCFVLVIQKVNGSKDWNHGGSIPGPDSDHVTTERCRHFIGGSVRS